MKNQLKISLIIPLYNNENFIEKCIESLYQQNIPIEEYEVIVVYDCSTDKSREKVTFLQCKFANLQIIDHSKNLHQGGARNTGIRNSKGVYIWFVDGDDFIKPNVLKEILEFAFLNDLDILHFDYARSSVEGSIWEINSNKYETGVISGISFFEHQGELWWKKCIEVWRKIHRRSYLIENELYFEEIEQYEDFLFSIKTILLSKKIMHIPITAYCYRYNPSSITNSALNGKKLFHNINIAKRTYDFLQESKFIKYEINSSLTDYINYQLNYTLIELFNLPKMEIKSFYNHINEIDYKFTEKYLSKIGYYILRNPNLLIKSTTFFKFQYTLFNFFKKKIMKVHL